MCDCATDNVFYTSIDIKNNALTFQSVYENIKNELNEKQRRLLLGAYANKLGRGGVSILSKLTGVSRKTISRGVKETRQREKIAQKIRHKGAGRKKIKDTTAGIVVALKNLVESSTLGDPMSPLLYTSKALRKLVLELKNLGYKVSTFWVAGELKNLGYSLQGHAKMFEGKQHGDRNEQFLHIESQVREHVNTRQPVVSVDTKKKELIGLFKNQGREYQPKGCPVNVNAYDFASFADAKISPYGVYDPILNKSYVNAGVSADTAKFAVNSLRAWWYKTGQHDYPNATELLIVADGGGSNGYRVRAWKVELEKFCFETGLTVTVCHLPPGTSKWNKIEHRMFSHISVNWRGRVLDSIQTALELIRHTTTTTGLTIQAGLDTQEYVTGIHYSKKEVENLAMTKHKFHPEWNYTFYAKATPNE